MKVMICQLCLQELPWSNPRQFIAQMRRHRNKAHKAHEGKIEYVGKLVRKKGKLDTQLIIR